MKSTTMKLLLGGLCLLTICAGAAILRGQNAVLKTPLAPDVLNAIANEVSGQMAYNNLVQAGGAPWVRDPKEFSDTFYEAQKLYDLVKSYGIDTVQLLRTSSDRTADYPAEGEFWTVAPAKRLIARIGADAALVASGSQTADVAGDLVFIPPLTGDQIAGLAAPDKKEQYSGKIALMWSHPGGNFAKALDAAGVVATVSYNSQERYFDPDQVLYGSVGYQNNANLKIGFSVSWRQWSELLEDVQAGRKITVRCRTRVEKVKSKAEAVFAWLPGSEPDKKGFIFTAHLFEGMIKRGADDNLGSCLVQLEILRALNRLIKSGQFPAPRRSIYFLWPNEISGTAEFLRTHPDLVKQLSVDFNMDMSTEALRLNNATVFLGYCSNNLPSYIDGLTKSLLNYVWRTNDIVFLPDSPRGRPRGQYFPDPMWEKNGSRDAFRFFVQPAPNGSDHDPFRNPAVGVPSMVLSVWPDQWYHADKDTADKADPTQMKRIAFVGAGAAWAAVQCTDEVLPGLLDAASEFGWARVTGNELPKALGMIETAAPENLNNQVAQAQNLVRLAVEREIGALRSIESIYTGSAAAVQMTNNKIALWQNYGTSLGELVANGARVRARQPGGSERSK
jgi:aminopeptidase YwaD